MLLCRTKQQLQRCCNEGNGIKRQPTHKNLQGQQPQRENLEIIPQLSRENLICQVFTYLTGIVLLDGFLALSLERIHRGENADFHKK